MTENEDGFIPVEECVAALSQPCRHRVTWLSLTLDCRRRNAEKLTRVAHPSHAGYFGRAGHIRIHASPESHHAFHFCEDLDELLAALTTIKRLTNNYTP